jgi:regulation of enolase protein 1 (concanavalin A-like superfamily)
MKTRDAGLAVLITAGIALAQGPARSGISCGSGGVRKAGISERIEDTISKAGSTVTTRPEIAGWGKPADPNGDCKFFVTEGELLISVPGANGPHDLAAEIEVINAPRILRQVRGDFVLQVMIDGRFAPGDESTLPGRPGYNGAGLVVMADPKNVICLARAVMKGPGGEAQHYANFEMRSNGEIERFGQTDDYPLPATGPVFLRIERRDQKISGSVSEDGERWHELSPKELPPDWPEELQAGVVAVSTSKMEFDPHFAKFQITK